VSVTNKGDDAGQGATDPPSQVARDVEAAKEQGDPPLAANTATKQLPEIQGGLRPLQPALPVVHRPEDFMTPMDKIVYGTLGDPITPDYVRDVNDLEKNSLWNSRGSNRLWNSRGSNRLWNSRKS
jgi:hypothetical protein